MSIICFRVYYFNYDHYHTIICIMFVSDYYHNYGFPILLNALFYFQNIISVIAIMPLK